MFDPERAKEIDTALTQLKEKENKNKIEQYLFEKIEKLEKSIQRMQHSIPQMQQLLNDQMKEYETVINVYMDLKED